MELSVILIISAKQVIITEERFNRELSEEKAQGYPDFTSSLVKLPEQQLTKLHGP